MNRAKRDFGNERGRPKKCRFLFGEHSIVVHVETKRFGHGNLALLSLSLVVASLLLLVRRRRRRVVGVVPTCVYVGS